MPEPRQRRAAVCLLPAPSRMRNVRSQRRLPSAFCCCAASKHQAKRVSRGRSKQSKLLLRAPGPQEGPQTHEKKIKDLVFQKLCLLETLYSFFLSCCRLSQNVKFLLLHLLKMYTLQALFGNCCCHRKCYSGFLVYSNKNNNNNKLIIYISILELYFTPDQSFKHTPSAGFKGVYKKTSFHLLLMLQVTVTVLDILLHLSTFNVCSTSAYFLTV